MNSRNTELRFRLVWSVTSTDAWMRCVNKRADSELLFIFLHTSPLINRTARMSGGRRLLFIQPGKWYRLQDFARGPRNTPPDASLTEHTNSYTHTLTACTLSLPQFNTLSQTRIPALASSLHRRKAQRSSNQIYRLCFDKKKISTFKVTNYSKMKKASYVQ